MIFDGNGDVIFSHLCEKGNRMNIGDMLECVTVLASMASVIVMTLQIKANFNLNRDNQTFMKIQELDEMLYRRKRLKKIIKEIRVLDDCKGHINFSEVAVILKKYDRRKLYEILNFFEDLSLSVFLGNVNIGILRRIYSSRICNAYEKLNPFIQAIADQYEDPNKKPYQHFSELYELLCELDGGENGYRNSENIIKKRWRSYRIYRKHKLRLHTK